MFFFIVTTGSEIFPPVDVNPNKGEMFPAPFLGGGGEADAEAAGDPKDPGAGYGVTRVLEGGDVIEKVSSPPPAFPRPNGFV